MGADKALLEVDGVAMAARVVASLTAAGCHPIVAVGGDRGGLEALGIDVIDDPWPGEGPLGGVMAALTLASGPVLVLACDLPWIDATTVGRLVAADGIEFASVDVVAARSDRSEPLCARWHPTALPELSAAFGRGERSVRRAMAALRVAEVSVDPRAVVDADTPEDLAVDLPRERR
jgi:molybdopterin-guanine dinucleotide biosynthesis protein A